MDHGSGQWRRGAISPRLARGLRRDLFRHIDDSTGKHWHALQARHQALFLPYRSVRDQRSACERAKSALRNCAYGFREKRGAGNKGWRVDGMVLYSRRHGREDGGNEDVLEVADHGIIAEPGQIQWNCTPFGQIGHHAIERMFMRLGASAIEDVLQELVESIDWMRLLSRLPLLCTHGDSMLQVPVPTRRGVLLCSREPGGRRIDARTFMRQGTHARAEASAACLRELIADPSSDTLAARFDRILQLPENLWWRRPHRA